MATRAEEKIASLMGERLVFSDQEIRKVLNEGQHYERHVYGDPALDSQSALDYLRDNERDSDVEAIKRGWDMTTVPMHGVFRQVLLPYLIAQDGIYYNKNRIGADALERAIGDIRARLVERVNENCNAIAEFSRAVDDAYMYRGGWTDTYMDMDEIIPIHEWVDAHDVLLDMETRSPRMRDKRWVGRKFVVPIETAEWMAENLWNVRKPEFTTMQYDPLDRDEREHVSRTVVPGARRSDVASVKESPTKFVKLVRIYVKGDNPYTRQAMLKRKSDKGVDKDDDVYDGKDHVLWLEASGGWTKGEGYKFLARTDWPFPCPTGETPMTSWRITKDNRQFHPYNIMQPAHMLQVAQNLAIQTHNTDYKNSAKRIVAINPKYFENEDDIVTALANDEALPILRLKQSADIKNAIMVSDFGKPNPSSAESQTLNAGLYRIVSGMQKFEVEVRANQTAHNTAVQHEAAQVKLDDISGLVEHSIVMCGRKAIACARKNMTFEEVSAWIHIPDRIAGDGDGEVIQVQRELEGKDKSVPVNDLWTTKPTDAQIRTEHDIQLETRSIRHKNPEKEAQSVKEIMDYQMQGLRAIGDTAKGGDPGTAKAMAKAMNNTVKRVAKLQNIHNYEDFMIEPGGIEGPPPEPPAPPPAPGGAPGGPPGDPNVSPQQRAAATRIAQATGVSPETMPPGVGGPA